MENISTKWQQAAHTTNRLLPPSCSTKAIYKSLTLSKKNVYFLEKNKVRRMDH